MARMIIGTVITTATRAVVIAPSVDLSSFHSAAEEVMIIIRVMVETR